MKYLAEYGYRIKEAVLLDYLRKTTKFQERQIKKFLDLITNMKNENNLYNRFNSWRKKLIYIGGYYYLALIPLLNCNICQLSEYWLEKCDLPMSKRGHEFEHYCKKKFQDSHKGILQKAVIDERTKYKVADIEEEIDLVMIIDNYIIIGEMKALAYPMDIIRWHNAYQELKKGIDQVRRKSHFLSENRHELLMKYSDYEGKRIVPVVITNYPLYAGFNENGIPVVDINLFLNILTNSPLIRQAISSEGATTVNEIRYYENEQEFALNFTEILLNPMPIKNLRKKLQIKTEVIPMMSESEVCFVEERYYINPSI